MKNNLVDRIEMKKFSVELKDWVNKQQALSKVPLTDLNYFPYRQNFFSERGEAMVTSLIEIGPQIASIFRDLVSLEKQRETALEEFNSLKGTSADKPGKKGKTGYFRVNRKFTSLVPSQYNRCKDAPRLSVKGSTFHGMAKPLLIRIVKKLTHENHRLKICDFDMSAAHSRIANSLMVKKGALNDTLSKANFCLNFFLVEK